jgi:hypothetical protein
MGGRMDIKIGSAVRIGGVSYRVLEIDLGRSHPYRVQAGVREPIWVKSDTFEQNELNRQASEEDFQNFLNHPSWQPIGSISNSAKPIATKSEIQTAVQKSRPELRTRGR